MARSEAEQCGRRGRKTGEKRIHEMQLNYENPRNSSSSVDVSSDWNFCMTKLHENSRCAEIERGIEQPPLWKGQSEAKWSEVEWRSRRPVISARFMLFRLFAVGLGEREGDGHSLAI